MSQFSTTTLRNTIFLLLVIFVISGCSLRGDNPQSPQTQNNEQKAVVVEQVPVGDVEEEEIDTSGWQTYRNEDYGLELKYPQSYEVLTTEEKFLYIEHTTKKPSGYGNIISIDKRSITELVSQLKNDFPLIQNIKQTNITIDGYDGIELRYDPVEGVLPKDNVKVYISKDDQTYIFTKGFGMYFEQIMQNISFL